jgi:hypothetical protein
MPLVTEVQMDCLLLLFLFGGIADWTYRQEKRLDRRMGFQAGEGGGCRSGRLPPRPSISPI